MRLPFSPPPLLAFPSPCPTQRLFDQPVAAMLHELCTAAPLATVTSVEGARKSRWAPVPLSTLEMQKRGSQVGRRESELSAAPHAATCFPSDARWGCRSGGRRWVLPALQVY